MNRLVKILAALVGILLIGALSAWLHHLAKDFAIADGTAGGVVVYLATVAAIVLLAPLAIFAMILTLRTDSERN